jgi:hypothetical protein
MPLRPAQPQSRAARSAYPMSGRGDPNELEAPLENRESKAVRGGRARPRGGVADCWLLPVGTRCARQGKTGLVPHGPTLGRHVEAMHALGDECMHLRQRPVAVQRHGEERDGAKHGSWARAITFGRHPSSRSTHAFVLAARLSASSS